MLLGFSAPSAIFGDLRDDARYLMPDDDRVGDVGAVAGVGMYVGAADAHRLYFDLGKALFQFGFRHVDQFHFPHVGDLYSFHVSVFLSVRNRSLDKQ